MNDWTTANCTYSNDPIQPLTEEKMQEMIDMLEKYKDIPVYEHFGRLKKNNKWIYIEVPFLITGKFNEESIKNIAEKCSEIRSVNKKHPLFKKLNWSQIVDWFNIDEETGAYVFRELLDKRNKQEQPK